MNISQTPVTVYQGMKLATAVPEHNILCVSSDGTDTAYDTYPNMKALDLLDLSHLPLNEQTQLTQLLLQFLDLFATDDKPVGRTTVVTHTILTTGPPICQPMHRIPEALKTLLLMKSTTC